MGVMADLDSKRKLGLFNTKRPDAAGIVAAATGGKKGSSKLPRVNLIERSSPVVAPSTKQTERPKGRQVLDSNGKPMVRS